MTNLRPAPVSSRQFSWEGGSASAEISSTNGLGRVFDDSCDEGLTVISSRTGASLVFVVQDVAYDSEGDVMYWKLTSTGGDFTMTLFND